MRPLQRRLVVAILIGRQGAPLFHNDRQGAPLVHNDRNTTNTAVGIQLPQASSAVPQDNAAAQSSTMHKPHVQPVATGMLPKAYQHCCGRPGGDRHRRTDACYEASFGKQAAAPQVCFQPCCPCVCHIASTLLPSNGLSAHQHSLPEQAMPHKNARRNRTHQNGIRRHLAIAERAPCIPHWDEGFIMKRPAAPMPHALSL